MAEPAAKKAKTDGEAAAEAKEEKKEEKKEEEPKVEEPKELEKDAEADKRPKIKEEATFYVQSTTMNVMPSLFGNILTCLNDGAFQYLMAGAKANVGLTAGRHMFEIKALTFTDPSAEPAPRGKPPAPKNCLRIGFSTSASSLILCDSEEGSVFFDAEGYFMADKKKTPLAKSKFTRGQVISVLLNLDKSSPNANTVSLFRDGERISEPQKLPESLQGKALYPAISFRNMQLQYNFGETALAPLPFKCKMLKEAAAKDASVEAEVKLKDNKSELLFPTGLPGEGTFLWLDGYLAKNPHYVELSDRAIMKWIERSGITRVRGYGKNAVDNFDKPKLDTGLPSVDDLSCQKLLTSVASLQPRTYVVMEVKGGLIKEDRQQLLTKYASVPGFKKTAVIVAGEPPADFKKKSQSLTLADKQEASDAEFKLKLAEEKKKKEAEKKKKEAEKIKKKAKKELERKQKEAAKKKKEAEKKKKEEEKKKKEEAEKKKKEAAKKKAEEEGKEVEEEEAKDEEMPAAEEEEKEEEEEAEEEEEEEEEEKEEAPQEDPEPPKAELTDEEKKAWFYAGPVPDLTTFVLNTSFIKFSLPEKAEGFDDMKYEWQPEKKAQEYVKKWIMDRKLVTRVEDVAPGEWFTAQWKLWQKSLQAWHAKQNEYKSAVAKKEAEKAAKKAAKEAKKMAAEKLTEQIAAAQKVVDEATAAVEAVEAEDADGEAAEAAKAKKKTAAEAKQKAAEEKLTKLTEDQTKAKEEAAEEDEEMEDTFDFEETDVFDADDINNVGGSVATPLFAKFLFEDWQMTSLRFEMNLLAHAFHKDVSDPDRKSMHADHLGFYYQKYYKKALNTKFYGTETVKEMLALIKDAATIAKNNTIVPQLPQEMETHNIYVMLTEEARRDRMRKVDLGDESAKLKITQLTVGGGVAGGLQGLTAVRTVAPTQGPVVRPAVAASPAAAYTPGIIRPQATTQPAWGKAPTPWRPPTVAAARPAGASPYGATAWRPSVTPAYGAAVRPAYGASTWRPFGAK